MSATQTQASALNIAAITRIVSAAPGAHGLPSGSAGTQQSAHGSKAPAPDRTGAIIGGVIGGVAGLVLLAGLAYWLLRRRRRTRGHTGQHKEIADPESGSTAAPTPQQKNSVDQTQVAQVQGAVIQRPPAAATTPATAPQAPPAAFPTGPAAVMSTDSLTVPQTSEAWRPASPIQRSHARSPSISSVISDYVDANEYAATPISANYIGERRYAEAQGHAFYSSGKSIRSMSSQYSLRAPSPCRSARYKSLDGAVLDEADLKLLRPVERGESGFFAH